MGCWNATCGLSSLPIPHRAKTLMVLLLPGVRNPRDRDNRHRDRTPAGVSYATDLWVPMVWPIVGTYNDYGSIEDYTIPVPSLFEKRLKGLGIETPLADIVDKVYDAEVVSTEGYQRGPVGHVLIRQDVWDLTLGLTFEDNWQFQDASINAYREGAKAWVDDLFQWVDDHNSRDPIVQFRHELGRHDHLRDHLKSPFASAIHFYIGWVDMLGLDAAREGATREELLEVGALTAEVLCVNAAMMQIRKAWAPGLSRGSQALEWGAHLALHEGITEILKAEIKRYSEDE